MNELTSIMQLSHTIMKHFISNDNNIIIISLKRLVLIYLRHLRIKKLNAFFKWFINSKKIKSIEIKLNNIEITHYKDKSNLRQSHSAHNISSSNYRLNGRNYSQSLSSIYNDEMISITKPNNFEIIVTSTNKTTARSKQSKRNRKNNFSSSFASHVPNHLEERFKLKESIRNHIESEKILPPPHSKQRSKPSKNEREKRLTILSQANSAHKEKKLEQIRQEQEEAFNFKCPFRPTLYSRYSNSQSNLRTNDNANSSLSNISFIERLQQYEITKRNNLSNIKKDIEHYIPRPQPKKKNNFEIPIQENYFQLKKQKVDSIKQNMDNEQGITFHPKLNDNKNKKVKDNVTKRNKTFLLNKEEKLLNGSYILNNNIDKECTFEPILSNNTKRNFHHKFDKRLQEYKNIYESHKDQLRLKYENSYSFMPKISKNTEMILNNKRIIQERVKRKYEECNKKNNSFNAKVKDRNLINKLFNTENIKPNIIFSNRDNKQLTNKNGMFCLPSQEIQEISNEETSSIANYESKELKINNDKKQNLLQSKNISQSLNKLKLTSESLTDDKAFQMAKLKLSVDDSLEKFQLKYSELTKKKDNIVKMKDKIPINIYPQEGCLAKKISINRMDYYDNLD